MVHNRASGTMRMMMQHATSSPGQTLANVRRAMAGGRVACRSRAAAAAGQVPCWQQRHTAAASGAALARWLLPHSHHCTGGSTRDMMKATAGSTGLARPGAEPHKESRPDIQKQNTHIQHTNYASSARSCSSHATRISQHTSRPGPGPYGTTQLPPPTHAAATPSAALLLTQ